MTTRTMDCIDCGESVPYGRLSCPACGALLASVAGANRGPVRVTIVPGPAEPEEFPKLSLVEPESSVDAEPATEVESEAELEPYLQLVTEIEPEPIVEPAPEPDAVDAEPVAVAEAEPEPVAVAEPEPEPEPVAVAEPEPEPVAVAEPEPEAEPVAVAETEPEPVPIAAAVATSPIAVPVPDASEQPRWPPIGEKEAILTPRPYQGLAAIRPDSARPTGVPAAYRAPAFALSAAAAAGPAWPGASAGATGFGGSASFGSSASDTAAATDETDEASQANRYIEIAGWFVIVGAAMATLGFLLPWSRVVIGAAHIGGYFDSWGLGSPTHMLVLAGVLVELGLGIVRTRIPTWLRTGVLGLATGSLLIGLVWPYVVGPLGADVGVLVTGLGGVALVIGGVLASWATRHARDDQSV